MGTPREFQAVLRRAAILFVASLTAVACLVAVLAWHHFRTAQPCPDPARTGGVGSCQVQAWHFGPSWAVLAALLPLLFGVCMLAAWAWSFARRR